ncbi:MAG: hypothetical protein Q8M72_05105 [Methylocystis sp.]|nr:hypothetical protein [Methylocystis sp.]
MEAINAVTLNTCFESDESIRGRRSEEVGVIVLNRQFATAEDQSLDHEVNVLRAKARSALQLAQRERDITKATRDRIQEAVDRANNFSAAIQRRLSRFVNLDKRIAEECAASILRSTGQEAGRALELSPKTKRLAERIFWLENQSASFRRASDCLRKDLANAESSLKLAEGEVKKAAVAVAAAEMEPIAAELARVESLAATLRRLLLGYGALRHDGGFLPMSSATAQLLRAPPKNAMVGGSVHCFEATAQWASYLQQLGIDSEATLDAKVRW